MTDPKAKPKPAVPTRTPQKKTSAGIFDNLRKLPHPVEEFFEQSTQPIPTHPNPSQPDPTPPDPAQPIAATRDYNKRHNSIDRAIAEGLFPGTSQKLYNPLFQRTRGAFVPTRTVKATKRELMAWSGIKSKNTIAINLKLLISIGWIKAIVDPGDHDGNVYEVFVYEELTQPNPTQPNPAQPNPSEPNPTQKLGGDPTQKLGWVGLGNPVDFKGDTHNPKTSFKTNTENDDDEAFARLVARLKQATREITGKEPTSAEAERWDQLAELLVTELKIAAGRTNVSSVPAFLTEHLRRRLWKKESQQIEEEGKSSARGQNPGAQVDASKCPDCFGAGMWYPEGFDKGVAKCRHEKLVSKESE